MRKILVDSASLDVDTMLCQCSAANGCWLHFGCSWLSRWLPRRLLRPAILPLVWLPRAILLAILGYTGPAFCLLFLGVCLGIPLGIQTAVTCLIR